VRLANFSLDEMEKQGMVIYGTPDDCAEASSEYLQAGVRHFTLSFVPINDIGRCHAGMEL